MARVTTPTSNFSNILTISQAADFLGVSSATLRNWDRSGKLKPRRHPQNGYRIYLHEDLEAILRSADLSTLTEESSKPIVDWNAIGNSDHFVQFYENDDFLIESATSFIGAALRDGGSGIVAATLEHRQALQRKLAACGVDTAEAEASGRLILLDARETLSQFMVEGSIDRKRFDEFVGGAIGAMMKSGRRLHAFGEMVALLWEDGNRDAAIELERIWNELANEHRFSLLCAYPISGFNGSGFTGGLQEICSCHSRVIPAESYVAADTEDKRWRTVTLLQQKARSLAAEIEHRREIEEALSKRERELIEAEKARVESCRRNDEFLATLSHELRGPLAPIRNSLAVLDSVACDESVRQDARSKIKREVEQITRIIDNLSGPRHDSQQ